MLRLEVPFGAYGEEVEVVVVVQPGNGTSVHGSSARNWVDESYGACADDPIERPEQGDWPVREELA